jgi:diacylglycerol kinase (ATP)
MEIVFVVNNKTNRLHKMLPGVIQYVKEVFPGKSVFLYTERKLHAIELARKAAESGCAYLIAVGGDGTLHEVVNGVLQSNLPKKAYPILGVLPCGSANDFARTALITNSIEALTNLIQTNSIQQIDLGKIHLKKTNKLCYFINIAGVGLGPEVVKSLEKSSGYLGAKLSYFRHIIKGFSRYHKKEVKVTGNAWEWSGKLLQMAVANGRYYGHAICTAPDACLTDGQFQVAVYGDLSIWDYLKNIGKLKKGVKIRHKEVHYFKSDEILIESGQSCGIEADGEYVGTAPAGISVLAASIRFLLPTEVQ